jgi:hypothetical protein
MAEMSPDESEFVDRMGLVMEKVGEPRIIPGISSPSASSTRTSFIRRWEEYRKRARNHEP